MASSCLWFDEIFSVHAAEHSWGSILQFAAADLVHPPLFYILLKLWIGIGGESLLWLRLLPVIFSVATVVPALLMARELHLSSTETTLALLLLAVNGYLIKYAQEVRMYSLLLMLSTISLWLTIASVNRPRVSTRMLLSLTAVNLLMIYSHYYGWLVVALEVALALWINRSAAKRFVVGLIVLLIAYIPWIVLLARAFAVQQLNQNIGWIARPGLRTLIEYAMLLAQPFVFPQSNIDNRLNPFGVALALLIFITPILITIWQSLRKREGTEQTRSTLLLAMLTFAPIVAILLASWILPRSIWGARHLIIVVVPFTMLAAVAIIRLQPYWARVTVILIVGCWLSATAVYVLIRPAPQFIWCAWAPLAEQVVPPDRSSSPTTSVYAFEDLVAYHLWFALRNRKSEDFKVSVIKNLPGTTEDAAYFLPRHFNEINVRGPDTPNERDVWIAFRAMRFDEQQPPLKQFMAAGYQIKQVLNEKAENQNAFLIELERK